jgi:N-acyl-L-homoserine lactone synthetase
MFKLINPSESEHFEYLSQMHHLRHKVFVQGLRWRDGIKSYSQMEFDDFDHPNCRYLVRLNDRNEVDACTRLTPTCFPYLLADAFGEYVQGEIPKNSKIIETSRFCANADSAPDNVAGLIMAAMLELGINNHIQRYVSLSDDRIKPVVHKYGWYAVELGPRKKSGGITCVALSYEVTQEHLENVKKAVGFSGNLVEQDRFSNDFISMAEANSMMAANSNIHLKEIAQ